MSILVVSNRPNISNSQWFAGPEMLEAYLKLHPEFDTLLFPFWSWKVEAWMLRTYRCYGLHTGPLLEKRGRGGSPINNLKALGIKWTTLCAFVMSDVFDGGSVKVAIPINVEPPKDEIIKLIDVLIPPIVSYLMQDNSAVPELFKRLPDAG